MAETSRHSCIQCRGTRFVKLTRLHDNDVQYTPRQEIVIYCPSCFGTGRELDAKERLEFVRKQREEDNKNKIQDT
jgi:hypothetical protein